MQLASSIACLQFLKFNSRSLQITFLLFLFLARAVDIFDIGIQIFKNERLPILRIPGTLEIAECPSLGTNIQSRCALTSGMKT